MALLNIRYDFRCPDICPVPVEELYHAAIEQAVWAEDLGFVSVTLSEHHGSDDGYLPSLVALASAIAARTENIHIMLAALIAPMHDPLRIAEDLAVLDRISKGRISVTVAGGYVPSEFEMFGYTTSDRVRLTVEMVETLKAAWTGEPFEFRGRTVRVTPTPYQNPRPAIWLGGSGEKAARRAARIADGFLPTMPEFWDFYRDEVIQLGRDDPGPATSGGVGYLHITHDPDATWAKVAPHALHEMNAYGQWAARVRRSHRLRAGERRRRPAGHGHAPPDLPGRGHRHDQGHGRLRRPHVPPPHGRPRPRPILGKPEALRNRGATAPLTLGGDLVAVYVGGELVADFVGGQAELVEGVAVSSEAVLGVFVHPGGHPAAA